MPRRHTADHSSHREGRRQRPRARQRRQQLQTEARSEARQPNTGKDGTDMGAENTETKPTEGTENQEGTEGQEPEGTEGTEDQEGAGGNDGNGEGGKPGATVNRQFDYQSERHCAKTAPWATKADHEKYVSARDRYQSLKSVRDGLVMEQGRRSPSSSKSQSRTFVNSFGEATSRYVTSATYELAMKRNEKEIMARMKGFR